MQLIQQLADTLGVAASKLIEIYAQRAPLEWVDVWVCAPIAFALILIAAWAIRKAAKDTSGDSLELTIPLCMFSVVAACVLIGVTAGEIVDAYKANKAPQAYAIDCILDKVR